MKIYIKMILIISVLSVIALVFVTPSVSADSMAAFSDDAAMNTVDMLWVLLASMLVFVMAPGLALFYGGMLRKQSMTSTIAQCAMAMSVIFLMWVLIGYSLAFNGDIGGMIGGLEKILMNGVSLDSSTLGLSIPDAEFMIFQGMFAIVTACIVIGASAERVRFPAIMLFLTFWLLLVYAPMAHMVWGGGLLSTEWGAIVSLDYAGGTVVHICSGITGVAIALVVGKRSSRTMKDTPHNVPLVFLGAILIWIGWIGFNGGSGLAVDEKMIGVVATTLISSVSGMAVWTIMQMYLVGRASVTGICAGCLAGLVAITPGCAFVDMSSAIVIGAVGSIVCYTGINLMRRRSGVDDALDVFGLHGLGGIWGAIATGIFALPALTDTPGLLHGSSSLFIGQILAVGFTLIYCFVVSFVIMKAISYIVRIRLTEEEELIGADVVEHGESAYN
jgi:ammonium transporter